VIPGLWAGGAFALAVVLQLAGVLRLKVHLRDSNGLFDPLAAACIVAGTWLAAAVWVDDVVFVTIFSVVFGLMLTWAWASGIRFALRATDQKPNTD
jgi:hypothetical protein